MINCRGQSGRLPIGGPRGLGGTCPSPPILENSIRIRRVLNFFIENFKLLFAVSKIVVSWSAYWLHNVVMNLLMRNNIYKYANIPNHCIPLEPWFLKSLPLAVEFGCLCGVEDIGVA